MKFGESSMATTEVKKEQEVYVLLPLDYDEGKPILSWALSHFPNDETKIIAFSIITAKNTICYEYETEELLDQKCERCIGTLDKHLAQCEIQEFKAEQLIQMNDSQLKGILELIKLRGVKNLVIGFSPNSKIPALVKEKANPLCKIWIVQKGRLMITRCPRLDLTEATSDEKNKYFSGSSFYPIIESSMATTEVKKEQKVYVLLPWNNYDEGNHTLSWTLSHFSKDETKIVAIFIIPPLSRPNALINQKREIYYETLHEHVVQCETQKFKAEKLVHEKDDEVEGIIELIELRAIKNLVMWLYPNSELVKEKANPSCKIWFIQNGNLISTKENKREMELQLMDFFLQKKNEEIKTRENENNHLEKENQQLKLDNHKLQIQHDDNLTCLEVLRNEKQQFGKLISDLLIENDKLKQQQQLARSCQFSLSELEQATQNFSDLLKIGEGGSGFVYKGLLRGFTVAIKKLKLQNLEGLSGFQQEVAILTSVRHPNIVSLIGSCSENSALVYEFMPNGSLENRLACANNTSSLTWQSRTRIISEICLGLVFLHSNEPHLVIHGDLKPDNILLDANFISKLSDFGISKIIKQSDTNTTVVHYTTHLAGTFPYVDPELFQTGGLTPKSDVYSFGLIMLRLLTGKSAWDIKCKVEEDMKTSTLMSIVDQSAGKWPSDLANALVELGMSCAAVSRAERPTINQVWAKIEPLVKVLHI